MPPEFSYPPKPVKGDRVAILSPSGRAAAHFSAPLELGLRRLHEEFGLEPVEYPTTRAVKASPQERAADVSAAFADPGIKAILATCGGDDQIKVLRYLDADVLAASPKPTFGYSDNVNLHLFLWNLGQVSYHGGSVMVQLGRPGELHPKTRLSLERALFGHGEFPLDELHEYTDVEREWTDPATFASAPVMLESDGWSWHGPDDVTVSGPAWGGCLEIIDFHLRAGRYLLPNEVYEGCVLFLETSEEQPSASYVYRVLLGMGERGLLRQFAAIVWARPKAWSFERRSTPAEKARYIAEQQDAVLTAVAEYHPGVPVVFGVDFGHADPQLIIPLGGHTTVRTADRQITVTY